MRIDSTSQTKPTILTKIIYLCKQSLCVPIIGIRPPPAVKLTAVADVADVREGSEVRAPTVQISTNSTKDPRVGTFNAGLNLLPLAWQNVTLAFEVDPIYEVDIQVSLDGLICLLQCANILIGSTNTG